MRRIDAKFYAKELKEDRQRCYKVIAHHIMSLFPNIKSSIDFGCGTGQIIKTLKLDYKLDVTGIEPNRDAFQFIDDPLKDFILTLDLRFLLPPLVKSDLGICLEVLEHLPEESAGTAILNITKDVNRHLCFSAARPGQTGTEHLNEQPFSYWEKKLNAQGFFCDVATTLYSRNYFKTMKLFSWYVNNFSIFHRRHDDTTNTTRGNQ